MVQFTFLEVHLDGAQFSAETPFSGAEPSEAKEAVESTVQDRLQREGDSPGPGLSPAGLLLGFIVLAGAVAVARNARSDRREPDFEAETETEEPIVAD